jgi:hypothetical protein
MNSSTVRLRRSVWVGFDDASVLVESSITTAERRESSWTAHRTNSAGFWGHYGLEAAVEIKRVAADVAEKGAAGARAAAERIHRTRLATERALATTEAAVSTKRITLRVSVREAAVVC